MSRKECPLVNAKPFGEALDEIAFKLPSLRAFRDLIRVLREMVNPDVCLTESQQENLFIDIQNMPIDGKRLEQTKVFALVAVINSYRTECIKCLAENCDRRDPHDV